MQSTHTGKVVNMASYKPADFYVGLVELFSILLPGAIMVALFLDLLTESLSRLFPDGLDVGLSGWVAFIVGAYIVGHLLKHVSTGLLNKTLYQYYLQFRGKDLAKLKKAVQKHMLAGSPPMEVFSWAKSVVRLSSTKAAGDIEQLEAESKFFRSLSLVFASAMAFALFKQEWLLAFVSLLLTLFALLRFCRLRKKEAYATYGYFLILKDQVRAEVDSSEPSPIG